MAMPFLDRIRIGIDRLQAGRRTPVAIVVSVTYAARAGVHATDVDLGDIKLPIEYIAAEDAPDLAIKSVEAAPVMESL